MSAELPSIFTRTLRRKLRAGSPRRALTLALLATAALGAREVRAQTDINPPLPDVLLLVDTSGSMEYKVGTTDFPKCYPDGSQASEKSRWVDLVEVLTGSIPSYRCQRINRQDSSFATGEYALDGVRPYDYLEKDPFHRLLSGSCAMGPGTPPTNAYDFPDSAIKYHAYDNVSTSCGPFVPSQDGILDSFENAIRFGLMTFDPLLDASTGVSGTSADFAGGVKGTWSYVWGSPTQGKPLGCNTPQDFDVGARNAAAPPWEGRLVPFGDPSPGSTAFKTKKRYIENVLLMSRPYGPTPIAGLLHDAEDFLTKDTSKDPLDSSQDFGPANDPYVKDTTADKNGCRRRYIILLTDGQPNTDLRPYCEGASSGTNCPFEKPEQIAYRLATQTTPPIETFVVGFALSKFDVKGRGQVTCNSLDTSDFSELNPGALCNSTDPDNQKNTALQACCSLNRIAVKGGLSSKLPRAFFADNRDQLASSLSDILTATTSVTSRTQPVVAGAAGDSQGFRFYSSVRPIKFQPWVGILERQRYECDSSSPPKAKAIDIDRDKQDDFAANVNNNPGARWFASIKAGTGGEEVHSGFSIRPFYSVSSGGSDGAGVYGGTRYVAKQADFVSATTAEMIQVTNTTCEADGSVNANACRDRYLRWLVGLENGTPFNRCKHAGSECYVFGDILHSTPRVVGAPSDFLQDESYQAFQSANRLRPIVLYTSTNDGFLHAFKVAPNDDADTDKVIGPGTQLNELWAFVPPAVLPFLRSQYPFTHQALLDGLPLIKDVVATTAESVSSIRFQRSSTDAQAGRGNWRTVLLQSFGTQSPAGGGYFALDVTSPVYPGSNLEDVGPRFLWQLTTDRLGHPLFGHGATPLITTLFFDPSGSGSADNALEIPVAVLPGGGATPQTSTSGCPATGRTFTETSSEYPPRSRVNCYSDADFAARSLTIVRLDTGEIVRTFRAAGEPVDADLKTRVITAPLDSPISGQPVAFPSETGAVADRVYVGDQDGRLWKVNLASVNPSNWKMDLFFDAFPLKSTSDSSFSNGFADGQPIALPPVLSVNTAGDVTVNVATGDQDAIGASPNTHNYVWSLTEKTSNNRTTVETAVNWYLPFKNGERTVGPMSLFNSQLFFTSFAPPETGAHVCSTGSSKVWGVDYLRPLGAGGSSPQKNAGGDARLPDPNQANHLVQSLSATQVAGTADAVIFGVSVAQQPSCSKLASGGSNDFLGYRTVQTVSSVNPGQFQLVMHIGGAANTTSTGNQQSNVRTVDLKPPASATRVDSWAALVE